MVTISNINFENTVVFFTLVSKVGAGKKVATPCGYSDRQRRSNRAPGQTGKRMAGPMGLQGAPNVTYGVRQNGSFAGELPRP